eukprot:SAG11_NODE_22542_length_404_cov_0.839344_1_plen_123_part_10
MTLLCGGGAADVALNTLCEDVDGRVEEMGEMIGGMVEDGGNWGENVVNTSADEARRKNYVVAHVAHAASKFRRSNEQRREREHALAEATEENMRQYQRARQSETTRRSVQEQAKRGEMQPLRT